MSTSILKNTKTDDLKLIVQNANSFYAVMQTLGYKRGGTSSMRSLKERLDNDCISTDHFGSQPIKNIQTEQPLEKILVENSTYENGQKLKRKLIKAKLKEDRCEVCGIGAFWNSLPLVLQLDHINGNHFDNRLENLQILCPNCHTQTNTFCGKGIKRKCDTIENKCSKCHNVIAKSSINCKKCAAQERSIKNRKVVDRPAKEILAEFLKTNSYANVGKMYNVSGNTIKKWLK